MKMSGVIPSVELAQLGFKAIMEDTGKIRLEKVDGTEDVEVVQKPSSSQD
jgi:hypothetical protein